MIRSNSLQRIALVFAAALACGGALADEPRPAGSTSFRVTEPPAESGFDPFYTKYVSARGFPVVGSEKVSDYALVEAACLIDHMLDKRPDIRAALIENKVRCAVMAYSERTTDVPEHSDLKPARYWDRRARGLGATRIRPAVSCGEENLLGYPGDPYAGECILIHEFAHAIHQMGLNPIDKTFQPRLNEAYESATKKGLWKGTYAAASVAEYWAEGVQSWFDTNRAPDRVHNEVNTREELEEYDPTLAALIAEVFRGTEWRYVPPHRRTAELHLAAFDRASAPTFVWSPELTKWYDEYRARKRAEREKK